MTRYVSPRPPEECYLCGHSHLVMAHWSSIGQNRALCHEDDHSCYTKHNHSQVVDPVLSRHYSGSALEEPNSKALTVEALDRAGKKLHEQRTGTYEITQGLSEAFKAMGPTVNDLQRAIFQWNRYLRPFGGPNNELKYRLNAILKGEDPGPPQNWVGLEEHNNVERTKSTWQTKK